MVGQLSPSLPWAPHKLDLTLGTAVRVLALIIMMASALMDIPTDLKIGPISSQGLLAIAYFCSGLLMLPMMPPIGSPVPLRTLPLALFLLWAAVSLTWTTTLFNGFQNVLAIATFLIVLLVIEAGVATEPSIAFMIEKVAPRAVFLAAILYGVTELQLGPGASGVIGARSFGLFALFGVAHHLSQWRYGRRSGLFWAVVLTFLIGSSQSRLALGIAIALFPLAQIPTRNIARVAKTLLVLAVAIALSYASFFYFDALRERFLSGDLALRVGDIAINVSGRENFWRVTMDSWQSSPIVGKGAGSAEGLVESVFINIRHPHNDYIRIAHDYGLIGIVGWVAGMVAMLYSLWRNLRAAEIISRHLARLQLTALLTLIAFNLEMTMENALVYIFVTAPLGLVLGSAFGAHRAAQRQLAHRTLHKRVFQEERQMVSSSR
jgi:O-antigen ligase